MIRVSFTKFLEFIAQTGEPKATTALQAWRQSNTPYEPARDYYKRVREELIGYEKFANEVDWDEFVATQNPKKQKNFETTIEKYFKWRGNYDEISWFDPPRGDWSTPEFQLSINPELGLRLDGQNHAVKLFFNKKSYPNSRLKWRD